MGWTGFHPPNVCVQSLGTSLLTAVVFWTELPHTQQSEPIVMWGTTSEQPPPQAGKGSGYPGDARNNAPIYSLFQALGSSPWVELVGFEDGAQTSWGSFFFAETTLRGAGLALPAVKHPVNGGCDSSVKWVAESNR